MFITAVTSPSDSFFSRHVAITTNKIVYVNQGLFFCHDIAPYKTFTINRRRVAAVTAVKNTTFIAFIQLLN